MIENQAESEQLSGAVEPVFTEGQGTRVEVDIPARLASITTTRNMVSAEGTWVEVTETDDVPLVNEAYEEAENAKNGARIFWTATGIFFAVLLILFIEKYLCKM